MLGYSPPGLRYTRQHPPQAAAPYFMGPAGPSSVNYGSSSAQPAFVSRRDPASNQRPHSRLFAVQIDGPQVQSHLYRGNQQVSYPLYGPPRPAPGGNPCGHQTPGMITVTPRPWTHHQNRGLYSPYTIPRRQEDVGYQRDHLHSKRFQQSEVPGWPILTNDFDSIEPQLLNWDGQAIAPPHGSHVNEVAPTPIRSATVPVPENAPPGFSTGTQPAGAPALGTEAPPEESRSRTGTCPDPACTHVNCGRLQELERHVLKHLPHYIYCPHPDCNWRGNRRYFLVDHYKKQHGEVLDHPDAFTIYDGKRLAKRLVNREVTLEQATDEAEALVRTKAVELGKGAVWNVHYV
ncbi:hypothetical protein EDB89DRAFT_797858 [Lactarius sanguifluus]|nr:hypothetical protein EDB89DRAFT_797858 [Lactarius sanguifluus]